MVNIFTGIRNAFLIACRRYVEVTIWSQGLTHLELYGYREDLVAAIRAQWPEAIILSVRAKEHVDPVGRHYTAKPGFSILVARVPAGLLKIQCMELEMEKNIRVCDIDVYTAPKVKLSRQDIGYPKARKQSVIRAAPRPPVSA